MALDRSLDDSILTPLDGIATSTAASGLRGIALLLMPDEIEVPLLPRPAREKRVDELWHRVEPKSGIWISLKSLDERPRVVRLTTRSSAPGWHQCRAVFSYAVRAVAEASGSEAVMAQDALSDDESSLTLLLLPHETREVTLALSAALDDGAQPGDYPFEIVLTDTRTKAHESTPVLLRLRHPSSSLLNMLPSVYTEALSTFARDETGSGEYHDPPFFARFLRGFEDASAPLEDLLANLDRFFGPYSAPPDFLPWLATWVALALDENWPQLKRRSLIREAVELYRWRGTRRGLSRYLEIYAGVTPEINDQPFRGMRLGAHQLGAQMRLGNVPPHTFVVTLAVSNPAEVNERVVRDIIESEKPAHTAYALRIVHRAARHRDERDPQARAGEVHAGQARAGDTPQETSYAAR